jgi:hypothetical protein
MNLVPILMLFIIMLILLGISVYYIFHFRGLCLKLTCIIKNMYCSEPGCTNLRYYSTPVDNHKAVMTEYCSIHLVQKLGAPDGN